MKAWSDEEVSAYLDGALEPDLTTAFEQSLAADPELQTRLEALRLVNDGVRGAFDAPLQEDIPDRFMALFEDAPAVDAAPTAPVVDLAAQRARRGPGSFDYRLPLAAGLALALGWGGGMTFAPARVDQHAMLRADATAIEPGNPLFRLLSETPSAQSVALAGGDAFKPVLSFAAADGRFCREFELASEEAVSVGVACRGEQEWRVEILLAADDNPTGADGYVQASGFSAAALDVVVAELGAGEPLGPEDEAAAISAGWRR